MTFHWCDRHALPISNLVVFHEKKINFLAGKIQIRFRCVLGLKNSNNLHTAVCERIVVCALREEGSCFVNVGCQFKFCLFSFSGLQSTPIFSQIAERMRNRKQEEKR